MKTGNEAGVHNSGEMMLSILQHSVSHCVQKSSFIYELPSKSIVELQQYSKKYWSCCSTLSLNESKLELPWLHCYAYEALKSSPSRSYSVQFERFGFFFWKSRVLFQALLLSQNCFSNHSASSIHCIDVSTLTKLFCLL